MERAEPRDQHVRDQRILILTPTGRDSALVADVFAREGIAWVHCADGQALCEGLEEGAGAVLVADEALVPTLMRRLEATLDEQPAWSDLPVILLTRTRSTSETSFEPLDALDLLGNVTLLERPVRIMTLVSAVRSALRARHRQYEVRDHLRERAHTEQMLKELDRRKDEFLAILAHELRNPLAPIENALHILDLRPEDPMTLQQMREVVGRQIRHLSRMVDDLLDVSRITRGLASIQRERVDLAGLLRTVVRDQRHRFDTGQVRLRTAIPETPVWVDGDPTRLTQILDNLLSNAAKFTDGGGCVQVSLGSERNGEQAVVRIRDTGMGIEPEMQRRLFQPFAQADRSLDRSHGGLGLGLAIVKGLMELHGGSVEAVSAGAGCGAELILRFPQAPAPPARDNPTPRDGGRERRTMVLVVEDNEDSAQTLCMLLTLSGFDVSVASDGLSGVQMAAEMVPDVVVCDIGLPGLDGFEVARRLRADPRTAHARLIALTGYGSDDDRARARQAGFDIHLLKPVDVEKLLAEIARGT